MGDGGATRFRSRERQGVAEQNSAKRSMVQRLGHTLLVEALSIAAAEKADDSVDEWLRAAKRESPQRPRRLYPELGGDER